MLYERHIKGDVLITFATGELTDSESDRTGLVPTHAYAMLDIKNVCVRLWKSNSILQKNDSIFKNFELTHISE